MVLSSCAGVTKTAETTAVEETTVETTVKETSSKQKDETEVASSGVKLNVAAAESVEAKDSFPVKVESKSISLGTQSALLYNDPTDEIVVTVKNNSGKTITGYSIYIVAYDENGEAVKINTGGFQSITIGNKSVYEKYTYSGGIKDTEIKSGENHSATVSISNGSAIEGAKIIVTSYTTADGEEVENNITTEWLEALFDTSKSL